MRLASLVLTFCLTALPVRAAHAERFGLGLELGSFVAVTGKYWFEAQHAVDFGVGLGLDAWTLVYADYLWHRARIFGTGNQFARETTGYVGGGAALALHQEGHSCGRWSCSGGTAATALAGRVPVGFEWLPASAPFGVSVELIPTILFGSDVAVGIDLGLGGRYYF